MTLAPQEFMRRFLLHVLPGGFHRIRHYGLLANGHRRDCLALARSALQAKVEVPASEPAVRTPAFVCRHCGRPLLIVDDRPARAALDPGATIMSIGTTTRHLNRPGIPGGPLA